MTSEIIQAIVSGIVTIVAAISTAIVAMRAHTTANNAISAAANMAPQHVTDNQMVIPKELETIQ